MENFIERIGDLELIQTCLVLRHVRPFDWCSIVEIRDQLSFTTFFFNIFNFQVVFHERSFKKFLNLGPIPVGELRKAINEISQSLIDILPNWLCLIEPLFVIAILNTSSAEQVQDNTD